MCVSQPLKQDPQNIKPHAKMIAKVIAKAKSHHRLLNFSTISSFCGEPQSSLHGLLVTSWTESEKKLYAIRVRRV